LTKRTTEPGEPRNDRPGEEWKPIPNYEGIYEVSNLGRVFRLNRLDCSGRTVRSRMLKISINEGFRVAYLAIPNQPAGKPRARAFYVDKAVMELFPKMIERPDSLPGEEWKDVSGYEGFYQISNLGRIHSVGRHLEDTLGRKRFWSARITTNGSDGSGYPKVELSKAGIIKTLLVHRLVAAAFVPNPDNLPVVNHIDEDKTNCRSNNLEWVTNAGNIQDWFDARNHRVDAKLIEHITRETATGKTPSEILTALPKKRKPRKS